MLHALPRDLKDSKVLALTGTLLEMTLEKSLQKLKRPLRFPRHLDSAVLGGTVAAWLAWLVSSDTGETLEGQS